MRSISPSDIQRAVHRARVIRRDEAARCGLPTGAWQEQFSGIVEREPVPTTRPHWFRVGTVHDSHTGDDFRVYLHELTGEVRLWTPVYVPPGPPPRRVIRHEQYGPRHFVADVRYRYFFDGQEYPPQECERICEERKSSTGWTWERRDMGPLD